MLALKTLWTSEHTRKRLFALYQNLQNMADVAGVKAALPAHHIPDAGLFGPVFKNPWETYTSDKNLSDIFKWRRERSKKDLVDSGVLLNNPHPTEEDYKAAFPVTPVDFKAFTATPPQNIAAVWVGHATVLVKMGQAIFLTDPFFSPRASPLPFAGPKRVVPPAFDLADPNLPNIDFILLSHNHYDHLDTASVKQLNKRFGPSLTWYVPLKLGDWFKSKGVETVVELDWWGSATHQPTGTTITFTPAQHWSNRKMFDRCRSLWGGYVVESPKGRKFWFAGDTAYCPAFKEIGERLGPIHLSAIPTGAYEPRWFMKEQHINPEEAVQIHQDVKSLRSMAIHCCTISLTDEPLDEPPVHLVQSLASAGLKPDAFITAQHGQLILVGTEGELLNQPLLISPKT